MLNITLLPISMILLPDFIPYDDSLADKSCNDLPRSLLVISTYYILVPSSDHWNCNITTLKILYLYESTSEHFEVLQVVLQYILPVTEQWTHHTNFWHVKWLHVFEDLFIIYNKSMTIHLPCWIVWSICDLVGWENLEIPLIWCWKPMWVKAGCNGQVWSSSCEANTRTYIVCVNMNLPCLIIYHKPTMINNLPKPTMINNLPQTYHG
jgi:hypothetical protein